MPRRNLCIMVYLSTICDIGFNLLLFATAAGEFGCGTFIATAAAAAEKNEQNRKKRAATAYFFDNVSDATATAAAKEYYNEQPEIAIIIGKTETVHHISFLLVISAFYRRQYIIRCKFCKCYNTAFGA